jgi:hypothetical protein
MTANRATTRLGLRNDDWYLLGQHGPTNVTSPGLVEGPHFEISGDRIRRLRDLGEGDRDFTFDYSPATPSPTVDFGTDAQDLNGTQMSQAVQQLRGYLAIAPADVTPAQREAALRATMRSVLALLKRAQPQDRLT